MWCREMDFDEGDTGEGHKYHEKRNKTLTIHLIDILLNRGHANEMERGSTHAHG